MRAPTTVSLWAIASLLSTATVAIAQNGQPGPNKSIYKGCYSTGGSLKDQGYDLFQTDGKCQTEICFPQQKSVMALTEGSHCWCGDKLPPLSRKVDDTECNTGCTGSKLVSCGGKDAWMVYLTGTGDDVEVEEDDNERSSAESGSSTLTSSASPSVVTLGGETKTVFAPDQTGGAAASKSGSKSSGPNKAGIAAGVVVGIVLIGAIVGGIVLVLRRRKRRAVEEEYRRNAANEFLGKDSASASSDSRLEPSVMMQRRQSDGSIADNQDYSRRILKVTNPDGT
ncbi:MAG: hypothetical protein M1833_005040 [Piccolia ochrophora]|nr:MAG: hypothetical protein M1833_005040 [Piccolia ochrophora]